MVARILAYRDVANWCFAAERAVDAIEAQRFPSFEIELTPGLRLDIVVTGRIGRSLYPFDIGIVRRERLEPSPIGGRLALPLQALAEGLTEFFASSSTNSNSSSETRAAQCSTAVTTSR